MTEQSERLTLAATNGYLNATMKRLILAFNLITAQSRVTKSLIDQLASTEQRIDRLQDRLATLEAKLNQ